VRELVIDGTRIADDTDCYIIAEVGHNHQGSVEKCKELFDAAKWSGANAVKLQKRDNKVLYTEEFYNSPYNSEHSYGKTYGEHREALEFDWDQYLLLKCYAEAIGLTFFATAFDVPSANFLAALKVPAFKIASGDLKNHDLLRHVAGLRIPVILSTGGGEMEDCIEADRICKPEAILQCTSGYPAKYDELNLNVIRTFRERFGCVIGYSGHDNGIAMASVAYALGARIIEKHFTLDRASKGTDQAFSLEPGGLRKMVRDLRRTRLALGTGVKQRYDSEIAPLAKQWKNKDGKIDGLARQDGPQSVASRPSTRLLGCAAPHKAHRGKGVGSGRCPRPQPPFEKLGGDGKLGKTNYYDKWSADWQESFPGTEYDVGC
jgi:sialic acid synthase